MNALARAIARAVAALAGLAVALPAQGIRCSGSAAAGGSLSVDVGGNESTVEVTAGGGTTSYTIGPDKRATVSVPAVPPGTLLLISVGRGARARWLLVEVLPP